jgi:hypothetical protein
MTQQLATEGWVPVGAAAVQAVRLSAWRRIRSALDEQRQALQLRIDAEDAGDIHLAADLHTWSDLADALCDLWGTRRAPR